jgi:hypothetical protein
MSILGGGSILSIVGGIVRSSGGSGGGSSTTPLNNYSAIVDPTVTDDISKNYRIGSEWINTLTGKEFVCINSTTGAAVWVDTITIPIVTKNNFEAIIDPTSGDNASEGYSVGSSWVNTITRKKFTLIGFDVLDAVWQEDGAGAIPLNNFSATTDPDSENDNANLGYSIGSTWINTETATKFTLVSFDEGDAIWQEDRSGSTPLNNYDAVEDPTDGDDADEGYSVGSTWINTVTSKQFILIAFDGDDDPVWQEVGAGGGGEEGVFYIDGGNAKSVYGGTEPIDGGGA